MNESRPATEVAARLASALADRYTIERELGAGGMATVYLAHDIKHDRKVAIKVLHPDLGAALGGDRFLSEIRTTARLQHPHILPLLDSGNADGLLYYVMPLVTGETLRARLDREQQLPINDAVLIAREVADALGYAHGLSVIHRDIKPENILLQGGHAVVADFGIALAVQSAGGARMTQTGLSLGTPQYMSPEQAMGERTIDARSDIYALGAVTYEMLVGDPPFTGSTVQAIVAKVLTERPTSPTAVRDTIPRHIEATVLHALAKLPADRFATAAEFSAALANPTTVGTASHAQARKNFRDNRPAQLLAGAALTATALAAWGWTARPTAETPPPIVKAAIIPPAGLSLSTTFSALSISSDGSQLAFVALDSFNAPRLFIRSMNELAATRVSGEMLVGGGSSFSPDGTELAFASNSGLWTVSTKGGTVHQLLSLLGTRGFVWGEDSVLTISIGRQLLRMRAAGGRIDTVASATYSGALYRNLSRASRDLILFDIVGDSTGNGLASLSLGSGRITRLGIAGVKPVLVNGHILVYFTPEGTAFGVEFDPRTLKTSGSPRLITDQVFMMSNGIPRAAVAANGTIAYLKGAGTGHRELVLVDRSGHAQAIGGAQGAYRFPRFSPNGERIAVSLESNAGSITAGDISVLHLEAGSWLRITTDSASYQPEWDPDGKSLVYVHRESRGTALYKVPADGSGAPVKLLSRPVNIWESRITPDHRMIVWREDNAKTLRDIMAAPLDSVDAVRPIVNSAFDEKGIALSPDGHWLAYVSNETGANQVYIRRLEPNSPHSPVSRRGGTEPRWSKTGELFFRSGDSVFVSRVTLGPVAQITPPAGLFSGPYESTSYEPLWDVSPDGRHFVMVRASANETPQLVLFMNWAEHWTTPRK